MLSCQKHLFSLDEGAHYLNCAYMGPLLRAVEAAGINGMRRKRDPRHIRPIDFFTESDTLRRRFAALVGAPDWRRVAIVPSASYALATVARNVRLERGQTVVVAHEQFPSNVYVWRRLAEAAGGEVVTVPPPPPGPGRGAGWNARLLEAVEARTAVVALEPVHWTDGTRFDLEAIGRRARQVGAALVVDGTQSAGALPFDVETVRPDALVCAGYKWLLGPYGIGAAYYGARFDGGVPLEENWLMRRGSEDFSRLVDYQDAYQPGATRYDVGERCDFIGVPMLVAALDQLLAWGVESIQAYCEGLLSNVLPAFERLGVWVEEPRWRGAHLFGLRLPPGADRQRVLDALDARRVSVSARGDAVRVSLHVYNEKADLDALLEALEAM